jgi:hypothetical protein
MFRSVRQHERNVRQWKLNERLRVLPSFWPENNYDSFHIIRWSATELLHGLIALAGKTDMFTIDIEHDYDSHRQASIQIEFDCPTSIIILIETCYMPHHGSVLFWLIRSLIRILVELSHLRLLWGDIVGELLK